MQLTGKQIIDKGVVINPTLKGIQQQGVDVRLKKVNLVESDNDNHGFIPDNGQTLLPRYKTIMPYYNEQDNKEIYKLDPGYYEIEFIEGCEIPNNLTMYFKTRSSLVRCGAIIHSGQFDGGFTTDNMGAFLQVIKPIEIEVGARVAQMIVHESYEVQDKYMYNGQYQNDKQRK